jgi:oligopeptide/dipeptide ABC transporter ATP-binding protein
VLLSGGSPIQDLVLEVVGLTKHFPARGNNPFAATRRTVKAVDDVSFFIRPGEVVAVVGESGCGKSSLGRLVVRLLEPTSGAIRLAGADITNARGRELRDIRLTAQIVFQDPFGSLNPRMTAGDSIAYPLKVNRLLQRGDGTAARRRVVELLERVGLNAAHATRLPHELSGGQRQRVGIARAIAVNPKLLVLDEPVAALDLSAQARVLNLFKDLRRQTGMSYLFITHDLSVAHYMADRILVMYAGKIVEVASRTSVFNNPRHPYTKALLSAAVLDSERIGAAEVILEGDPPSTIDPPPGCRFNTRCPYAIPVCTQQEPALLRVGEGHLAACHLVAAESRVG